ncbi:hypothetical protein JR316_0009339 [Psilocybe cubensis]|uniref:Uncharacterized protein n=2 Tax=Psilocybe cubensis TaxID=181762 RepID=A0ACB8GTW9_PSICU|nr:hypothetical protein JR316_0009339 [Psilocybe cubensis]KAH9478877.1 hypothetical protein JR316_0009339 [Psilocybe cubensis]
MPNSAINVSQTPKRGKIVNMAPEPLKIESSLISRLNADIVGEIFTVYVDQWIKDNRQGTTPTQPAIYVLCKVNQEWRRLARRTPRLWRCIIIWYSTRTWNTCEALLSDWIQCAASSPLQVYVFSTEAPDTELHPFLRETLMLNASKWSSFICLGPTPFWGTPVKEYWSFPQLKSIAISLDDDTYCNFSDAPLLKELVVRNLQKNVSVHWSQLTLVDIAVEKLEYAILPLKELKVVQDLRLTVEQWLLEDQLTVVTPKLHPHLRKLSLHMPKQTSVIIFNALSTPALTDVSLYLQSDPNKSDEDWLRSFLALISRPGRLQSLTSLKLGRLGNITEAKFVSLLAQIPSIINIEILNPGFVISDTIVDAMNPQNGIQGRCMLPNATHVMFKNVKIQFDGFLLLNMLKQRKKCTEHPNDSNAVLLNKIPVITSFKKIEFWYNNPEWIRSDSFEDPNLVMLFFYEVFKLKNSNKILLKFCCLHDDPFED